MEFQRNFMFSSWFLFMNARYTMIISCHWQALVKMPSKWFHLFIFRSSIMLWFLWELRNTMKYEHSTRKLDFLLHFGASSLVWFIYLPIVAIVASQVSPLWRYKLLLGTYFEFIKYNATDTQYRFASIFLGTRHIYYVSLSFSTASGITNSADCLGYCVMTGLLWPNRAGQYLLLASTKYSGERKIKEKMCERK